MRAHNYFVYILTNKNKNVLYTGVTNDLVQRLTEHYLNRGNPATFAGKYQCHFLIYYERHQQVTDAISREKIIKGWSRQKKLTLIDSLNPERKFLNEELMVWPPEGLFSRGNK